MRKHFALIVTVGIFIALVLLTSLWRTSSQTFSFSEPAGLRPIVLSYGWESKDITPSLQMGCQALGTYYLTGMPFAYYNEPICGSNRQSNLLALVLNVLLVVLLSFIVFASLKRIQKLRQ
ncbi:MAG: hypothetical protein QG658_483 [Patescibacteria group bacterium]|nr:hypothetical protein [Patescibacteria group bacterium]